MYEKEIEDLERIRDARDAYDPQDRPAFDTAIALMRAAEPKDEAAEREHCAEVHAHYPAYDAELGVAALLRERAAVRAPLQAEIERLRKERDQMAFERDTHMEANQERAATYHTNGVQSLNRQVSELQAENERLRAEIAELRRHVRNNTEKGE